MCLMLRFKTIPEQIVSISRGTVLTERVVKKVDPEKQNTYSRNALRPRGKIKAPCSLDILNHCVHWNTKIRKRNKEII